MANKVKALVQKIFDFGGVPTEKGGNRLSVRNYITFPLGTIGRDFLYQLFNGYLMTFILFTKTLDEVQFLVITILMVIARIFDAFNDPIMGGIVENTRSKWGKYKPWQLIGAVLTGAVVVAVFCTPVDGWGFIGLFGVTYIMFSFTFTMNDISYWGMLPALTSHPDDRNKLTSLAQICASAGAGFVGLVLPWFTTGWLADLFDIGAIAAYKIMAILSAVLIVVFQLVTVLGVKEKPLPPIINKQDRIKLKDMFKIIVKNDQLMWSALVLLLASLGTSIIGGSLLYYFYFEFGYNGDLFPTFVIGMSVASTAFTVLYPWLVKKFDRRKSLYVTFTLLMVGYLFMMIFGLSIPTGGYMSGEWWAKFVLMAVGYTFAGLGQGYYMIMFVSIANTVEYNEWKTGERNESLIFSVRPITAQLSSALQQGVFYLICLIAGVLQFTNGISEAEKLKDQGIITGEQLNEQVEGIITSIPEKNKMIFLSCMCVFAIVLIFVSLVIYHKKCKLDENVLEKMMAEIEERKAAKATEEGEAVEGEENVEGEAVEGETADGEAVDGETADGEAVDGETNADPPQDGELEEAASDVSEEATEPTSEVVDESQAQEPAVDDAEVKADEEPQE